MSTKPWLLDRAILIFTLGVLAIASVPAHATEIWSGRSFGFAKAPFASVADPVNQDRISNLVWITRGNTLGIYNIAQEGSFLHNLSPVDTEWATGDAVNHASLSFADWETWTGSNPPASIGVNACVHLITEDIYLDIVFDAWGVGGTAGGSFAYRRALPPATPTTAQTWGRIKALYR